MTDSVPLDEIPDDEWDEACRELDLVFPGLDFASFAKDVARTLPRDGATDEELRAWLTRPFDEGEAHGA